MKEDGKKETHTEQTRNPSVVKCDVCGRDFNRSYLKSHKRLSHGKRDGSALKAVDKAKAVETIHALYLRLPPAARKDLLERLISLLEAPSE